MMDGSNLRIELRWGAMPSNRAKPFEVATLIMQRMRG